MRAGLQCQVELFIYFSLYEQLKGLDFEKRIHMMKIWHPFNLNVIFADEIAKGCRWPGKAFAKEKNIHIGGWKPILYPNPANQTLSKRKWEVLSLLSHVKRSPADYLIIAVLI